VTAAKSHSDPVASLAVKRLREYSGDLYLAMAALRAIAEDDRIEQERQEIALEALETISRRTR
jgi:DNA phosphorothioation-dependent restriction protein DptG